MALPYVNPKSDEFASRTMQAIYRAEWEDYMKRYAPYEDKLTGLVGNQDLQNQMLERANTNVDQAFGLADAAYKNRMASYGTQQNGLEKQTYDRSMKLAQTAAKVGTRNSLRDQMRDTENQILAGGLSDTLRSNREEIV